ncbi:MAG: DNA polymerase III subunit beta [Xanthomonadaceae bacterium]|nr:DNA polymerase III subunit beta [Xanthomonadaceae bacterium]
MKFQADRETLLKPIQAVVGVVERRQTMPILANMLLVANDKGLSVTATDLEVELVATVALDVQQPGEVTVPGRKLLDICRALPDGAKVSVAVDKGRVVIKSGRSRFTLSTLPATEFPSVDDIQAKQTTAIKQDVLAELIDRTHFAMAQQDVRYYLNGMLLELRDNAIRAVATDGHRLAMSEAKASGEETTQVIVPRKGVLELHRLLGGESGDANISFGANHLRVTLGGSRLTTKLIDGRFPDYERVLPKGGDKDVIADRQLLREALQRASILSNEKYRGVRLQLSKNLLKIQAHNPEQEEAEDEVEVEYGGAEMEIGFNVNYLLDALGAITTDTARITLTDGNSSCLIREPGNEKCKYVVMPMRL